VPLCDFLIFSPRWDVASHTFRPPASSRPLFLFDKFWTMLSITTGIRRRNLWVCCTVFTEEEATDSSLEAITYAACKYLGIYLLPFSGASYETGFCPHGGSFGDIFLCCLTN
jgi:hypothetical protein